MTWILVALVLYGDILIVLKNRLGFYLWIIVDGFFCLVHLFHSEGGYAESAVFGLYALMGVYGLIKWKD